MDEHVCFKTLIDSAITSLEPARLISLIYILPNIQLFFSYSLLVVVGSVSFAGYCSPLAWLLVRDSVSSLSLLPK